MQENDFILLLHKRCSGDSNAEESALLDNWIRESPEHERLARQYQLIWEKAGAEQKTFTLDMDVEFQRFRQRLNAAEAPRGKVVPLGYRLLRVAAALAVLLTALWGYRQFAAAPVDTVVAAATNVEKRLVQLPDGSQVWLRQNSSLRYPSAFAAGERRVQLDGEAYFQVAHRETQPFRIEIPDGGTVEVLGTEFSVAAPAGQTKTTVLVRSGRVRFSPDGSRRNATVLTAQDRAEFDRSSATLHLSKVSSFNELAWQTGGLEFVATPLQDVIRDLEAYYHVKIELRNPALRTCLHTAPLTKQPLDRVLESLSLTYQIQVSNPAPGQFILSGGRCN